MAEEVLRLSGDALRALERIRGDRDEELSATLRRILSVYLALTEETARGASVVVKERDGTERDVPL